VVRAYLGIYGRDIDRTLSQALGLNSTQGIVINSIAGDTPAGRAGLKEGDVIKSLNGNPVGSYDSFRASIATSKPGAEVILDIIRDGESQDVEVTLGELDQESTAEVQDSNEEMEKSLGFRVEKLNADIAQRLELEPNQDGVIVTNVNQGSNAYENGLRRYDVITSIDKQPVRNIEEFRDVMNEIAENDKSVVLLRVIKQGVSQYIAFEL
jgi:serine protease Do